VPSNPRLSRRTAVGGVAAAAVALVTGCTSSDDSKPSATRTPSPSHSPGTDPDVKIAAAVLERERALLDRVAATARKHPRLAPELASARAAHRAHVALLTKAVPNDTPVRTPAPGAARRVPSRPGPALSALAAAETRLGDAGARSSLAARSGPFARVLASMAAAASQQSAHLTAAAAERA
jgi:hypothetical protein